MYTNVSTLTGSFIFKLWTREVRDDGARKETKQFCRPLYARAYWNGGKAVVICEEDDVADESEFVRLASLLLSSRSYLLPSEFRVPVGDLSIFCFFRIPDSDGTDATGAYTVFAGAVLVSTACGAAAAMAAAATAVYSGGGTQMPPTSTIWACWGLLVLVLWTAGVVGLLVCSRYF